MIKRIARKKLVLCLILGILLGWVLHGLTTTLIIRHYESKPVVLGSVAYAQEKAQTYRVDVWWDKGSKILGKWYHLTTFKIGKVAVSSAFKKVFEGRFKEPGRYLIRIFHNRTLIREFIITIK